MYFIMLIIQHIVEIVKIYHQKTIFSILWTPFCIDFVYEQQTIFISRTFCKACHKYGRWQRIGSRLRLDLFSHGTNYGLCRPRQKKLFQVTDQQRQYFHPLEQHHKNRQ